MKTLYALDIETRCALECTKACDHALIPHTSLITRIGVYSPLEWHSFDRVDTFREWFYGQPYPLGYIGHNLSFDIKHLEHWGITFKPEEYYADTQLMGSICLDKVSEDFLARYRELRRIRNAELRSQKKKGHRPATPLSLKVMAPYYLGVPAFWETTDDHSNPEYNRLDCEYTYRLWEVLSKKIAEQELSRFFSERLMPWARMLLQAQLRGINIDLALLQSMMAENDLEVEKLKANLDEEWAPAYEIYGKKINLNSPTQLTWLLRDHFGLDIKDFDGEETTGRDVLQRLAATGRRDIELFLKYRENEKLATSFFRTYQDLQHQGVLHPNFNVSGTRTGRLSANNPNLQQVPGHLKTLFVSRPGRRLITRDLNTIEPRIAAYYTEDPVMCRIFTEDRDFHSQNALVMFGLSCPENEVKAKHPIERNIAKTVGLAILYGAGSKRIKTTALKEGYSWDDAKCRRLCKAFRDTYPIAGNFKFRIDNSARNGDKIVNLLGRAHRYDNPEDVYMKTFNTLCQSSASDLMLEATHRARKEFIEKEIDCYPLLWVHDECVWEGPEERVAECEEVIERHLTSFKLSTPYGDIPLKCEGNSATYWAK